ncbi:MAG: DUF2461 domain-containing protein [Spirochaetaceae bacterium]|nr:DUF2461 domain-containing protein [Spirochaetaceae bacterium]
MQTRKGIEEALAFLRELKANNDRAWFEANRPRYEAAREAFEGLVGELIARFGTVDDLAGVSPRECVFRINRDVRFSADKSPYKTAMGALLGPAGRKSGVRSYYLHLEPGGKSMLAGGLHSPTSAELGRIRNALASDTRLLKRLLAAPSFAGTFGGLSGESLKTAPQGYPKDHPEIELLRRKQYLAILPLSDAEVAAEGLVPRALEAFAAMKPFLLYLERSLA